MLFLHRIPHIRRVYSFSSLAFPSLDIQHPKNNVPQSIRAIVRGRRLLREPGHPLACLKTAIFSHFNAAEVLRVGKGEEKGFSAFESALSPLVTSRANFDELLTPIAHASRRPSDTFYVDDTHVLRCHMTAHQTELLRAGYRTFLMAGDVYRRDTVDRTHAPVFHQLDGVRVWSRAELPMAAQVALIAGDIGPATQFALADLRTTLESLAKYLFGASAATRWVPAHFPFTEPSLELEVEFGGKWLEVLGAGVIRNEILATACRQNRQSTGGGGDVSCDAAVGWAFGVGLERLAMVLHAIPDIRLFWSQDARFAAQFIKSKPLPAPPIKFKPFSSQPACYKDVAFWVPAGMSVSGDGEGVDEAGCVEEEQKDVVETGERAAAAVKFCFHENDFHAAVREAAGDLAEAVERIDRFVHPKTKRTSLCFRVLYRSADRSLTNEEVDSIQAKVVATVKRMGFEIR
jgi:phenylalanyl-tRNA synthetase alpha chain